MADLLGCICLMESAKCKCGCATHNNNNRVDLRNAHFTEHQVPFEDVSQPPEQAMFAFVEERIDSDKHKIIRPEAWSNGRAARVDSAAGAVLLQTEQVARPTHFSLKDRSERKAH